MNEYLILEQLCEEDAPLYLFFKYYFNKVFYLNSLKHIIKMNLKVHYMFVTYIYKNILFVFIKLYITDCKLGF